MTGVASAIGAAAVVGAGASIYSANQQAGAAKNAQSLAYQQQQQNIALEQPYNNAGVEATGQLQNLLGLGTAPAPGTAGASTFGSLNQQFNADDWKQLSPSYGFQLQQGQQGVLNQETGTGALSGAALKDLTSFNQGLASTSFNNAFNMYQQQQNQTYSRLANLANLGQNAASMTGQQNTSLAGTQAQAAQNIGTANAGGAVGVANALGGGATNAAMWAQYGGGGGGTGFVPNDYGTPEVDPGLPSTIPLNLNIPS
jgi:hypothetical protein